MAKSDCKYEIPIERWSSTDYAYLVNNHLGFVSDDCNSWLFFTKKEMDKFAKYLKESNKK